MLAEFTEAQSLDDISAADAHVAQQVALVRLQLFVVGEVHRLLLDVVDDGLRRLRRATADEVFEGGLALNARSDLLTAWDRFFNTYTELIGHGLREGASIPFGTVAIYHRDWILPNLEERRRDTRQIFAEQLRPTEDAVFTPQLQEILDAAEHRVYGDRLRLSERIWRLDQLSRREIDRIIAEALAEGSSAWDTAQRLEQYLGPGRQCPRWTEDRLYGLTKGDIAGGDKTGLLTGAECDGAGVAYNALRLARTEIQAAHHMATDLVFKRMPWIEKEQIHLSPDHAHVDICDDVVSGGDKGDGVYEKGEISLPLHPHCLCWKSSVLIEPGAFVDRLKGWMQGTSSWAAMDQYQQMLGGGLDLDLSENPIAVSMSSWLWETPVNLTAVLWRVIGDL
jgi:hypothetical protein